MILKQFYLGCLSHASYFIADQRSKTAAVVDPQRDVEQYLGEAERLGVAIRHVLLTHFHADFIAGHLELRERTGAQIYLGAKAVTDYSFTPLSEGETIELGDVRLSVLETPGHTPEAISILVFDRQKSLEKPHAVLTGDTLFIGDVGRPDLLASAGVSARELAGSLHDSLQKLLRLPDETLVYPAHGAGSMCGKNLSQDTVSTIGQQRALNYALQPMDRERFIELVSSEQPAAPAYFAYDADLNRRNRPTLEESLERALKPLGLEQLLALAAEGAQVLDARDADPFAAGHLRGSVNIGLSGKFATWAGTLLDRSRPIVLVADPGREQEAAMRLGRIGFDFVAGFLEEPAASLSKRPELIQSHPRIPLAELERRSALAEPPVILDVRARGEWEQGHIEGSLNIPLPELRARIGELPAARDLVVHCKSGYRSSTACSLLAQSGRDSFADLTGGFDAWAQEGFPTISGAPAGGTCER